MTLKELELRLAEVQQAISDILSGAQEALFNGQKVRKAEFEQLIQYEKSIQRQITAKKRGGIRIRGVTPV